MKKRLEGLIMGVLCCALLSGITSFAKSSTETIQAVYNNIKIYVDGLLIDPKDADGKKVEPFIYNGTTYLPVRAIGEALGKKVYWEGSTKSVWIGEKPGEKEYLVDVCPPYQGKVHWVHTSSDSSSTTIAGKKYTNALVLGCDHSLFGDGDGYALFNLDGKYEYLSFEVGRTDEYEMQDVTLNIYLDGRRYDSYDLYAEDLPRKIKVDLDNALQLKLEITGGSRVKYGFINAIVE